MKDELVYDGWLKVYKREVKGKRYDILKNYDAVAALVLNEFNEVLLVKQFRPAFMKETLEIPAGSLDIEGESKRRCLTRELKEEANITVHEGELEKIIEYKPIMGFSNSTMSIFRCKINKNQITHKQIRDDDVTEVIWISLDELEVSIQEGNISDSKTILCYYYLKSNK
ncbi:NUDIX domain-containing protein [Clostridium bovifaecis]|uniref:NUDIX domain-containing protein n=1 Tax=Clostridium bovifaecis TaxID=2184719 RepID=A0A6I6EQU3_9CLOT|nr:NUDIX domain-containing protein [Clostridium bovifaecis]